MKSFQILLTLCYLFLPGCLVYSQINPENIKVFYQLSGGVIDFYEGDQGLYGGGVALEYHRNKLYLATPTKVFWINLSDTSHSNIELGGLYRDPYGRGILDIASLNDTLYVLDYFERLLLIQNNHYVKRYTLNFSNLKLKPGGHVYTPYLFSSLTTIEDELFFGNDKYYYPYSFLRFKGYKDYNARAKGNKTLSNDKTKNLLSGNPIMDCYLLTEIKTRENDSLKLSYQINDYCADTTFQIFRSMGKLNYEVHISKELIFKNNLNGNYYAVVYLLNRDQENKYKDSKVGLFIMNTDLTVYKTIYPIPKPAGETLLQWKRIFTSDEYGNIYYLNTIFGKTAADSEVQIYKIKTN